MSSNLSENLATQAVALNANAAKRKKVMDAVLALAQQNPPDLPSATLLSAPLATAPASGTPATTVSGARYATGIPGGGLTTISEGGQKWTVAKGAATAFQGLLDTLAKRGYRSNSSGGYNNRDIRGRPGVKSEHAFGRAIDINAAANPMGSTLVTNLPKDIGAIAASYGLVWGGNFKNRKDPMHFEYDKQKMPHLEWWQWIVAALAAVAGLWRITRYIFKIDRALPVLLRLAVELENGSTIKEKIDTVIETQNTQVTAIKDQLDMLVSLQQELAVRSNWTVKIAEDSRLIAQTNAKIVEELTDIQTSDIFRIAAQSEATEKRSERIEKRLDEFLPYIIRHRESDDK